jgi:2-polyprenyl-3-methyl-5-hydroxy-6-metoxy-1,4-benzoquinol methylase
VTIADARQRCDVCGTAGHPWFARGSRQLLRCPSCRFSWVPEGILLTPAGVSIYEDDTGELFERQADYYYDETAVDAAADKVAWVSRFLQDGASLLDAGANIGLFVAEARRKFDAVGIEPSPVTVRRAADHAPGAVVVGSIYDEDLPFARKFEAITLFDVIEHLDAPRRALDRCRELLKPGGLLFLTTPDIGSPVARLLGPRWHYLDLDQHVSIFSRSTLSRMLVDAGFTIAARRTFGRRYRTSYIRRRLQELGQGNPMMRVAAVMASPLALAPNARIPINLGDVMGIAARVTG